MAITARRTFPPLAGRPLTDRAVMREVGLLARERIVRRTVSGQDQEGKPFKAYSKAYARQKQAELGGAATVNLQVSGAMLNAIRITEVTDDSVTLGFA